MALEKLLIIGCSSKIAQEFIDSAKGSYEIYGTYLNEPPSNVESDQSYKLDLSDSSQIIAFLEQIKKHAFSGVLFFASTYEADASDPREYQLRFHDDLQINSFSTLTIAKFVTYAPHAKVFLFGDSGIQQPKKRFTGYSLSKAVLGALVKIMAVELANEASVICFMLGPTKTALEDTAKKEYFARNVLQVSDAAAGLVDYILFFIKQKNLSVTGVQIPYDGGAYLARR